MALSIHCFGRVQGVFYRASTEEKARELGLCGWVKNESDGTVLIHAEGDSDKLKELVEWCKVGPRLAVVTRVEFIEKDDLGFKTFDVRL